MNYKLKIILALVLISLLAVSGWVSAYFVQGLVSRIMGSWGKSCLCGLINL